MAEPWGLILASSCVILFVVSGCVLVYGVIRHRSLTLGLICLALVVWPITGELLNATATHYAREAAVAGDTYLLGVWWMTPGGFITKVALGVEFGQSLLVLVASIAVLRFANRRRAADKRMQTGQ